RVLILLRDPGFLPPDVKPRFATSVFRNAAHMAYRRAFPIYRSLYAAYKAYSDRMARVFLKRILFPGAVIADVGANIGVYSTFFSRCVGPTGIVYSFEPSRDNF